MLQQLSALQVTFKITLSEPKVHEILQSLVHRKKPHPYFYKEGYGFPYVAKVTGHTF